jgi:hypothetical protein
MGLDMKKFFVVISVLIGSLFYSTNTAIVTLADIRPGETKVNSKNLHESILVYSAVTHLLTLEYVRIEDNLARSDRNYTHIRNYISALIEESSKNMDPKIIELKVLYSGSEKYLNEYKGLFMFLFNIKHITSSAPEEIMYTINKDGRITYFEARNMFRNGDIQVFDRSLLSRFSITKEKLKKRFDVDL